MMKKRIRTILTIAVTLVMLTAVLCALFTLGDRYRDRNNDKTEQEDTRQEASDAVLLPEKNGNEIRINTVPVADDDAVRELHRALNLVLSDPATWMKLSHRCQDPLNWGTAMPCIFWGKYIFRESAWRLTLRKPACI